MDNTNYDKLKIFSELFEEIKEFEKKKVDEKIYVSTESWIAQLGERNLT